MKIQGEKLLTVPREAVWRALNDPATLQRCIPGCDKFEPEGDNRFAVSMQASVGPVRARFSGKLELRDVVAPTAYSMTFEGSGGVAGFGKGTAQVALEDFEGSVRLRYEAEAQVGGRLAQVGARLIDGVTKKMADDFFSRFVQELGPEDKVSPDNKPADSRRQPQGRMHTAATPAFAGGVAEGLPPAAGGAPNHSHLISVIAAAVSGTAASVAVLAAAIILYHLK